MPAPRGRRKICLYLLSLLMLCSGIFLCTMPLMAQPLPHARQQLPLLYRDMEHIFWNSESQLQRRADPFSAGPSPYALPLSKKDPLYQNYFYVDNAAGQYIQLLDAQKQQSWTLPPVLYLGGIAAFTIGDYANAEKYLSRLLHDYPHYKRDVYIGDNYAPDPDFSQPVQPGISKLLFYCLTNPDRKGVGSSTPPSATNNAFTAFPTIQPGRRKGAFHASRLCGVAGQPIQQI